MWAEPGPAARSPLGAYVRTSAPRICVYAPAA